MAARVVVKMAARVAARKAAKPSAEPKFKREQVDLKKTYRISAQNNTWG
jgi:hypothetical protein